MSSMRFMESGSAKFQGHQSIDRGEITGKYEKIEKSAYRYSA